MTNFNPALLSKSNFSNSTNESSPDSNVDDRQTMGGGRTSENTSSNRLFTILSLSLTIIIGFWIGFLINEYFYQVPIDQPGLANSVDEFGSFDQEAIESDEDAYIIFQEQNYAIGETITLSSNDDCLKNLSLVVEDIQKDIITFQIEGFDSLVREDPGNSGDGFVWGEFKDPLCFSTQSLCGDALFDYCFYMTHIDGLHYLDYDLEKQRSSESLIRTLEL
jgi:hypothetical protein